MVQEQSGTEADADGVGRRLKAARTASGLQLSEIAARTRVPQRHLEAIEADDYSALPSSTYGIGFARAYARAVGEDEVAIAAIVRAQLAGERADRGVYLASQPADPARVPPRTLAWTAAVIALLVIGAYVIWRAQGVDAPMIATAPQDAPTAAPAPTAPRAAPAALAAGPVVLTATDVVWLRIRDGAGERLFEKEMQAGETYTVPADADAPTITTGRPNALRVTVGNVVLPPLGEPEKRISDVGISAEALRARSVAPPPAPPPAQ